MNNFRFEQTIDNDFKNCCQLSDYEAFVLKYNSIAPNHELVNKAKAKIASCAREKKVTKAWPLFIIGGIVAIAAGIGLIMLGCSMEGESAYNTYHGEHGDYRVTNYKPFLGIIGLLGGIALAILGIYGIGAGIYTAVKRNNI